MKSDFEVIRHKLPNKEVNIYALGDWHIGSKECRMDFIEAQIEAILKDKNGFAVMCGDAIDNALPNSKSNIFEATMTPQSQMEKAEEYLGALVEKGKLLAVTDGNHEFRSVRETSISPLYTLCCRLRVEDIFRPYMCLMKLEFGKCGFGRPTSQNVYYGMVMHGSTRGKNQRFEMTVEPLDFACSAHTHQAEMVSRSKIRIDSRGTAKQVHFLSLVCCSALGAGGYGLQKQYTPGAFDELQYITLKPIGSDRMKRMEYHTSQL